MDEEEFTRNYLSNRNYIYYVIGRYVYDAATVEDLTQHTFLKAWVGRHSFKGDSTYTTWLTAIAINTAFTHNLLQKRKPQHKHGADVGYCEDESANPIKGAISYEEMDVIYKAIRNLKPELQQVVVLRAIYNYEYEDIAKALEIPVGTVRSRLHRARYLLRDLLK